MKVRVTGPRFKKERFIARGITPRELIQMIWDDKAERAISRVPFFVRKRVRRRVEDEARHFGSDKVRIEHVRAVQQRYLTNMEEEVRGYRIETCFGPGGCPNRAVREEHLVEKLEAVLKSKDLRGFLKDIVQGPLKLHNEFRITISDCPNACSRPQIVDIGIIGACKPRAVEDACTGCGQCVDVCKERAIDLPAEGGPIIDPEECLMCGQCIKNCPAGALEEEKSGYRVLLGGRLGRHPRLGTEIAGIKSRDDVVKLVERCVDHFMANCLRGERFGEVLERTGLEPIIPALDHDR